MGEVFPGTGTLIIDVITFALVRCILRYEWAYQTSKWMREVHSQNGIEINWKFFSLEEVNHIEGKKHP